MTTYYLNIKTETGNYMASFVEPEDLMNFYMDLRDEWHIPFYATVQIMEHNYA